MYKVSILLWAHCCFHFLSSHRAAGCSPFAVSIIGDYFPQEFRGTAIGVYYWGVYIGYSLAFAIGNGIQQALNWRWVFFLSAFIGECSYRGGSLIRGALIGNGCSYR